LMVQAIATGYIENLEAGRKAVAASVEQTHYEPKNQKDWQHAYKTFKHILKLA
jgi:hypothetical protein